MKTPLSLLAVILVAFVSAGCGRHQDDPPIPDPSANESKLASPPPGTLTPITMANPPAPLPDPVAAVVLEIKVLPFESRENVTALINNMDQQLDAQLAQWKSTGRQFNSTAQAQLSTARDVAKEKLDAFAQATPETWTATRDNAVAALEQVRGAMHVLDTSKP